MIQFREATVSDITSIALLHAESWRKHYRGIWKDTFLDNYAQQERMDTWQQRLSEPKENQYILLAEKDDGLCGFACIYLNDDPVFGTLVDNLHVLSGAQDLGIGTQLMRMMGEKINDYKYGSNFYLWVLKDNHNARKFYEHLGGKNFETVSKQDPDGGFSNTCRYIWKSVIDLRGTY